MPTSLYNDLITIIKKSNGEKAERIKASVQNGKKAYYSTDLFVEIGDTLIRKRGDNYEEYIITEPNFYDSFGGIQAHYQSDIIRKDEFQNTQKSQSNQTFNIQYNLDGNSRINNNSIDNSLNHFHNTSIEETLSALNEAKLSIQALNDNDEKISALKIIDIIASQIQPNSNYKTLSQSLLDALPSAIKTIPSVLKFIEIISK